MPPHGPSGHPCDHDPAGAGAHEGLGEAGGDGGLGVGGDGDGGPKVQAELGMHCLWLLG